MDKDRAQRYQSARDLLEDLQSLQADLERDDAASWPATPRMATTENVLIEAPPPTNLPHKLTPLVGRDAERDDVLSLLRSDDVRMVTLTGPGGTGKTRLSLAIGAELLREMDDGVWWVSLAPIRDRAPGGLGDRGRVRRPRRRRAAARRREARRCATSRCCSSSTTSSRCSTPRRSSARSSAPRRA